MAGESALRGGLDRISRAASNDLTALWRQVSTAAEAQVALNDILPALIEQYGMAAATMAADWYDEARTKAGVGGRFAADLIKIDSMGAESLIGWSASTATTLETMLPLVVGGVTKRITLATARTIGSAAVADPRAKGWQRVAHGTCSQGFCDMLAGRGAIYTEATADFAAHDHCRCTATVAWKGQPVPVKPYVPGARGPATDADKARVRAWLASN